MILHGMYYANEVRDFKEVPRAEAERVKQLELDLGAGLIDQMANDDFEPTKYRDEYRLRVEAMLNEKVKGHEIMAAPEAPHKTAPVIDLMEALKRSMRDMSRAPATRAAVRSKAQKRKRAR
jgi:DNA end-binding protein Ku